MRDLIVIDEQFPQIGQVVANDPTPHIRDPIFGQYKGLDVGEILYAFDILVRNFGFGEI